MHANLLFRVANVNGNTVVCHGDMITQAFYRYSIDLAPYAASKPAPTPGEIMTQR